jgi:hypothetical protein
MTFVYKRDFKDPDNLISYPETKDHPIFITKPFELSQSYKPESLNSPLPYRFEKVSEDVLNTLKKYHRYHGVLDKEGCLIVRDIVTETVVINTYMYKGDLDVIFIEAPSQHRSNLIMADANLVGYTYCFKMTFDKFTQILDANEFFPRPKTIGVIKDGEDYKMLVFDIIEESWIHVVL